MLKNEDKTRLNTVTCRVLEFWVELAKELRPNGQLGKHFLYVCDEVKYVDVSRLDDLFYRDIPLFSPEGVSYLCVSELIQRDLALLFGKYFSEDSSEGFGVLTDINEALDSHDTGVLSLPSHVYFHCNLLSQLFEINSIINNTVARMYCLCGGNTALSDKIYNYSSKDAKSLMDLVANE